MYQPFFIWFLERSGSTHLTSLMNSHPMVNCRPEILHEGRMKSNLFETSHSGSLTDFFVRFFSGDWQLLNNDWQAGTAVPKMVKSNSTHIGFKLKYTQLKEFPEALDLLLSYEGIKIIHLYRRNILRLVVSKRIQMVLWEAHGIANIPRKKDISFDLPKIYIEPEELINQMNFRASLIDSHRKMLRHHEYMEVSYEELIDNEIGTVNEIQEYLGVSERASLKSSYKKIANQPLFNILKNYEEVAEVLNANGLAHFLTE